MKKHVKVYLNENGYTTADTIACEVCGQVAVDIHHIIPRGMGGSHTRDMNVNLIALCRKCHGMAEQREIHRTELNDIAFRRVYPNANLGD